MINELRKEGLAGDELVRRVMELLGCDEQDALELIDVEDGGKGDHG